MRKVIVNSTPLIALSKTGRLDLLRDMYREIYVPKAVFEEVTAKNDVVKSKVERSGWIHVEKVQNNSDRRMYRAKLHDGEVEVMMLARECGEDHLVVIDDEQARKTAEYLGLNLTGTLGVLIKAKRNGLIDSVMSAVRDMEAHGIYFSISLKERVRRLSGE